MALQHSPAACSLLVCPTLGEAEEGVALQHSPAACSPLVCSARDGSLTISASGHAQYAQSLEGPDMGAAHAASTPTEGRRPELHVTLEPCNRSSTPHTPAPAAAPHCDWGEDSDDDNGGGGGGSSGGTEYAEEEEEDGCGLGGGGLACSTSQLAAHALAVVGPEYGEGGQMRVPTGWRLG